MRNGYSPSAPQPQPQPRHGAKRVDEPRSNYGLTINGNRLFPTTMDSTFQPKELVRRFSEQVRDKLQESGSQDDHELERCLTETLEAREGKRRAQIEAIYNYQRSSSNEERLNLKHSRHALEAALESFGHTVSKDQEDTIAVKLSSWQDVKTTIEKVQARWEQKRDNSKFRRGAEYLRSICNTIDSHSAVLEMLPSSNDYASVLCGGLTTVVKASANYTNIVETLPRALLEINNIVAAVEREIRVFEAPSTKSLTWRMYGRIFTLLTHVVQWYTQRWSQRLLRSFNENLAEFFETQLRQIRQDSDFIRRDISLQAHTDARLSRLYNESLDDKISFMMTLEARDRRAQELVGYRYQDFRELMDAEQRKLLETTDKQRDVLALVWTGVRRRYTGDAMSEILEGRAQTLPVGSAASVVSEEDEMSSFIMSSSTSTHDTLPNEEEERVETVSTRELVLLSSARLEDFFDREKVQPHLDFPASFYVPSDISASLQPWAVSTESRILHLCGTDRVAQDDTLSRISGKYASLAREAGLPVVSYTCILPHEAPQEGWRTRETVELTALAYALIRQLIELLPSNSSTGTVAFGEERFKELDGTLATWTQTLELLGDLLPATGHSILVIVIHGVELLEHKSTAGRLRSLLKVLCDWVRDKRKPTTKVLFTSDGVSRALNELLDHTEVCISTNPAGKARSGSGWQPLAL